MSKIGLIAMSAKPIHVGHELLIKLAARESDQVMLFVSTSDRARPGEITISGKVMEEIWKKFIEPELPKNVHVEYRGSPVSKIYKLLGDENEAGSDDTYVIYSDPSDIQKSYPQNSLEKYANDLYNKGRIVLEPISRSETVDVSGTQMRRWLESNDKELFIEHLPSSIRKHGDKIWNMLKTSSQEQTKSKTIKNKK